MMVQMSRRRFSKIVLSGSVNLLSFRGLQSQELKAMANLSFSKIGNKTVTPIETDLDG